MIKVTRFESGDLRTPEAISAWQAMSSCYSLSAALDLLCALHRRILEITDMYGDKPASQIEGADGALVAELILIRLVLSRNITESQTEFAADAMKRLGAPIAALIPTAEDNKPAQEKKDLN